MASTPFADIKIGDTLILATNNRYRGDETVTVSRIGRAYVYVARNGREIRARFFRETGIQDGVIGSRGCLYTPSQRDDLKQRQVVYAQLVDAGIEVTGRARDELTADQLRAILTIVQPDTASEETT